MLALTEPTQKQNKIIKKTQLNQTKPRQNNSVCVCVCGGGGLNRKPKPIQLC